MVMCTNKSPEIHLYIYCKQTPVRLYHYNETTFVGIELCLLNIKMKS